MTDYLVSADEAIDPYSPWAPILAGGERVMEKEFRRENSQVVRIKAFEDNVSVKSSLTYGLSMKNNTTFCNTSLDEHGIDLSRITVLGYQSFK